jgi:TRAP-type C4-dicarboxylate transport system substrate-binding protein
MRTIMKWLLVVGAGVSIIGSAAWADDYPKMKLRYANFLPQNAVNSRVDMFVASEITRRTNGSVKVEIYHGETLGKPTEVIDLVGGGAIDIGNIVQDYHFSRMPLSAFFNPPMIHRDHVMAARLAKLGYQTQEKLREDMRRNNLYPLLFRALAPYRLISKKPIRTIADFKGLKLRTAGSVHPKMFEALGAVPVNMVVNDAYEGLRRGTLDAVYLPWTGFYIYKLFEVAPYISDVNFGAIVGYGTFINLDLWNSWPPDFQELCRQIGLEAERLSDKIVGEFDRQALDMMLSAGAVLVHFQEQEQLEKAVPDPIELVEQSVAAFAKSYEAPARKYGDFLRTRLAQGHE